MASWLIGMLPSSGEKFNGGIVVNLSAAVTTSAVAVEVAKVGGVEHERQPGDRPREGSAT